MTPRVAFHTALSDAARHVKWRPALARVLLVLLVAALAWAAGGRHVQQLQWRAVRGLDAWQPRASGPDGRAAPSVAILMVRNTWVQAKMCRGSLHGQPLACASSLSSTQLDWVWPFLLHFPVERVGVVDAACMLVRPGLRCMRKPTSPGPQRGT